VIVSGEFDDIKSLVTHAARNGISLADAVLTGADLTGADLTGAVLTDAVLTRAVLTRAVLTDANMDFSAWPLWCGSLTAKTDDRLNAQLLYHVISVMGTARFTDELIDFANTFHRVGECGKLTRAGSGQVQGGVGK
jgi:hypothetical protein